MSIIEDLTKGLGLDSGRRKPVEKSRKTADVKSKLQSRNGSITLKAMLGPHSWTKGFKTTHMTREQNTDRQIQTKNLFLNFSIFQFQSSFPPLPHRPSSSSTPDLTHLDRHHDEHECCPTCLLHARAGGPDNRMGR